MAADIYDWISQLKSNQWVLDVGSGAGSLIGIPRVCRELQSRDREGAVGFLRFD
jgi:hypothetical protein